MEKKVKIIPNEDRILVKSIKVESKTKSGLVLSTDEKIDTCFAEISAVADNLKEKYKIGEIVYHSSRAGIPLSLYSDKYLILTDTEVLAKLTTDKNANVEEAVKDNLL